MSLNRQDDKITESQIRYLHPNIDYRILDPSNKKLLPDAYIDVIRAEQSQKPSGAVYKYRFLTCNGATIKLPFAVIGYNERLLCAYHGKRKEKNVDAKRNGELPWQYILGHGSSAYAKLAMDLATGELFALKCHLNGSVSQEEMATLIELKKMVYVENNIPFTYVRHSPKKRNKAIGYLVMHLTRGINLYQFLITNPNKSTLFWVEVIIQILEAVYSLHQSKRLHGDISLENIMIDPVTGEISLIDFGSTKKLDEQGFFISDTLSGTPKYVTPDLVETFLCQPDKSQVTLSELEDVIQVMWSHKMIKPVYDVAQAHINYKYTYANDLYALGIVFAEILGLVKLNNADIIPDKNACHFNNNFFSDATTRLDVFELIKALLSVNGERRPAVETMLTSFHDIKNKLTEQDKCFTVALINLHDYMPLDEESKKSSINNLKKCHYDIVQLVDQEQQDDVTYWQVESELYRQGVLINRSVYHDQALSTGLGGLARHISTLRVDMSCKYINALTGEEINATPLMNVLAIHKFGIFTPENKLPAVPCVATPNLMCDVVCGIK